MAEVIAVEAVEANIVSYANMFCKPPCGPTVLIGAPVFA